MKIARLLWQSLFTVFTLFSITTVFFSLEIFLVFASTIFNIFFFAYVVQINDEIFICLCNNLISRYCNTALSIVQSKWSWSFWKAVFCYSQKCCFCLDWFNLSHFSWIVVPETGPGIPLKAFYYWEEASVFVVVSIFLFFHILCFIFWCGIS